MKEEDWQSIKEDIIAFKNKMLLVKVGRHNQIIDNLLKSNEKVERRNQIIDNLLKSND